MSLLTSDGEVRKAMLLLMLASLRARRPKAAALVSVWGAVYRPTVRPRARRVVASHLHLADGERRPLRAHRDMALPIQALLRLADPARVAFRARRRLRASSALAEAGPTLAMRGALGRKATGEVSLRGELTCSAKAAGRARRAPVAEEGSFSIASEILSPFSLPIQN